MNLNIPPVVKTLLIINVVVFALSELLRLAGIIELEAFCALFYFKSPLFLPFQFVTYMFMHGGFSHLFFNMFALWMFGNTIERYWGSKYFLIYYMVCGIGAGIIQEIGQMLGFINPGAMTIGASGAVYGVLLAFGMTFPNEKIFIIPIPIPLKAKYFVMIYVAIELFLGSSSNDNVAHYAHLGGMLFGLILILYWKARAKKRAASTSYNTWTSSSTTNTYDKGKGGMFGGLKNAFGGEKKPKMKVTYTSPSTERERDYEYNARKKSEAEEIDRILDKVRQNGYTNLTDEEKRKLFDASKR